VNVEKGYVDGIKIRQKSVIEALLYVIYKASDERFDSGLRNEEQYSNAKWNMPFFKILKIEDVNLFSVEVFTR